LDQANEHLPRHRLEVRLLDQVDPLDLHHKVKIFGFCDAVLIKEAQHGLFMTGKQLLPCHQVPESLADGVGHGSFAVLFPSFVGLD